MASYRIVAFWGAVGWACAAAMSWHAGSVTAVVGAAGAAVAMAVYAILGDR